MVLGLCLSILGCDTDQQELAHRSMVSDLKASVLARRELDPELEDEVLEAFLTRLEARVEPAIIGGLVLRIGDQVIDASVASRLQQLRRRLAGV